MNDINKLREILRTSQEKVGYFFNKNNEQVLSLLQGLTTNRDRYGYMSCPCRLASCDREKDRDIICPCAYREEDVAQYGSCYCGLYVSDEWNTETIPHAHVPERRPPLGKTLKS